MRYLIIIEKTGENYSAYAPDVPGCGTVGDTVDETKRNMREALALHLAGMQKDGEELPDGSAVADVLEVEPLPDEEVKNVTLARRTRDKLGVSQSEFARMLGVPVATLRNWEQGRTVPDGPGQALLNFVLSDPKYFLDRSREASSSVTRCRDVSNNLSGTEFPETGERVEH